MKYVLSVFSVLSAPVIYGLLCVPTLGLLYAQFPDLVDERGGTQSVLLLLVTEFLQLLVITVAGYVAARLAPNKLRHHVVLATVLMLVIGVSVQLSFWDLAPAWHHFVFFACILGGMHLGGSIRSRQLQSAAGPG